MATGTNADDARAGFRPGIAAAAERGAVTPLLDAGLTKEQIRAASRAWGLPTWDKPAAACLSSRIAYGIEITPAPAGAGRARRGGAAARRSPRPGTRCATCGCATSATVRGSRSTASWSRRRATTWTSYGEAGFDEVEVDPLGFRSGSMNELLADPEQYR